MSHLLVYLALWLLGSGLGAGLVELGWEVEFSGQEEPGPLVPGP